MWAYSVLRIEMKNSLEVKFSKQTCTHAPLVIQPPSLPLSIYVNLNQSKDLLTELNEIFWDSSGTLRVSHGVLGVFFPPCSLVTLDVPTFKYCSHNMDFPHTHPVQLWFEWFLNSHICKKETQRSKLTFTGSEECCAHSWEPILKHTHTHSRTDSSCWLWVSVSFPYVGEMRSFVIVQSRWQLQQMSGSSTTRCVLRASSPAAPPLSTHQPEPCNINTPTHPGECTEQKLNISWRMCQKRKGTHTHEGE